jgi:phospholipase C
MPEVDRRRFLQLAGGSTALSVLTPSIARAASIPAYRRAGSLEDVEHVVVLMQENRSFDHYFGTMRGVRGYGDPHPAQLPSGRSVFHQERHPRTGKGGQVLPFRPDLEDLGLAFLQDLDHGWDTGHHAFANGDYDAWVPAKHTGTTMAHLRRADVPFHYALADAFTVCDAYHCSMLGPTNPNRYYLWTGWAGNDGKGGGPEIGNVISPAFRWKTYPERLQHAGVSWRIYQDQGDGLDAAHSWGWTFADAGIGNYGDNVLLYFKRFQDAQPHHAFYHRSHHGTKIGESGNFDGLFAQLRSDVQTGKLPQVSWIVAPEAFSEHPDWPPNYGAWYVAKVLDALTSDPDVWATTVLFLTFDENDGFFDHVVPPYPNVGGLRGDSTVRLDHELYTGKEGVHGPYGLGVRVPMTVVSPWSTGGWVCSETFDHTSIIRFVEKRFGVHEPNITKWRRTVCGDLTSAFDFSKSPGSVPPLPDTSSYKPPNSDRQPPFVPTVPHQQHVPQQEPGIRPSRALGYRLRVDLDVHHDGLAFTIANRGRLGTQLQVRSNDVKGAPFSYTVGAGRTLRPVLTAKGPFDVSVHGPNGFFRRFSGNTHEPLLEVRAARKDGHLVLTLHNRSNRALKAHVEDAYARDRTVRLGAGKRKRLRIGLAHTHGWYDVLVTVKQHAHVKRALAGRIENGRASTSDPQLGS